MGKLNKIEKVLMLAIYSPLFYIFGLGLLNDLVSRCGPKIKDKSHLEILVNQEKKNLGIENKNINISFCDTIETSYSWKTRKNSYEINLYKDQRRLVTLKHELYHIADNHCDENYKLHKNKEYIKKNLKYFLIQEPQALIYSVTGIKL